MSMIKPWRRLRQLSQAQLAKRAHVSQAYIAYLERGVKNNPSLTVLQRLATALGISVDALVTNTVMIRGVRRQLPPIGQPRGAMTPEEIQHFHDDALALRRLLVPARRDPTLSPDEVEEYDALSVLCTQCLVLTDEMRDRLQHAGSPK